MFLATLPDLRGISVETAEPRLVAQADQHSSRNEFLNPLCAAVVARSGREVLRFNALAALEITMSKKDWPEKFWKTGFDDRRFLSEEEWRTYLRRPPVRRIREKSIMKVCACCGKPPSRTNPLQWAHRIHFVMGVNYLALTPDYLDSRKNRVRAHRKTCNAKVDLGFVGAIRYLKKSGVTELREYLPIEIRRAWQRVVKS